MMMMMMMIMMMMDFVHSFLILQCFAPFILKLYCEMQTIIYIYGKVFHLFLYSDHFLSSIMPFVLRSILILT